MALANAPHQEPQHEKQLPSPQLHSEQQQISVKNKFSHRLEPGRGLRSRIFALISRPFKASSTEPPSRSVAEPIGTPQSDADSSDGEQQQQLDMALEQDHLPFLARGEPIERERPRDLKFSKLKSGVDLLAERVARLRCVPLEVKGGKLLGHNDILRLLPKFPNDDSLQTGVVSSGQPAGIFSALKVRMIFFVHRVRRLS